MNLHQLLFLCFFSALCGGNTRLVSAKLNIYTGFPGGNGTINCHITPSGSSKFFCRDECKAEDLLIRTKEDRAASGRHSLEYSRAASGKGIVSVTITRLRPSDAGRYRCGLGKALVPDSYSDFEVRVSDAHLDVSSGFVRTNTVGENITYPCSSTVYGKRKFFCKNSCQKEEDVLIETEETSAQRGRYSLEYRPDSVFGLYVIISQASTSDTGHYRCGYGRALSPDSDLTFNVIVLAAPTTPEPNWTPRPASASAPPASPTTAAHSLSPSSDTFPPSTDLPESTEQAAAAGTVPGVTAVSQVPRPGYIWPLLVCTSLVGLLLLAVFLLLYLRRSRRSNAQNCRNPEFPVIYKKLDASTPEASTYKSSGD